MYEIVERASGDDRLTIDVFPGVSFVARDLLPDPTDHFVDNG